MPANRLATPLAVFRETPAIIAQTKAQYTEARIRFYDGNLFLVSSTSLDAYRRGFFLFGLRAVRRYESPRGTTKYTSLA